MGKIFGSINKKEWIHFQLKPTGQKTEDDEYDKIQEDINTFNEIQDLALYQKDLFMYAVDMDIYPYATSYDGIVGLMYAIASKCSSEYEFTSSFEPKLVAPFVFYNPQMGQQLTAACKQL